MLRNLAESRSRDWSLNLEDPYYTEHPDEMLEEALAAVGQTERGHYVNLVTPESFGDPFERLIPELRSRLAEREERVERIVFVDQCGCGGYVTRVYK